MLKKKRTTMRTLRTDQRINCLCAVINGAQDKEALQYTLIGNGHAYLQFHVAG